MGIGDFLRNVLSGGKRDQQGEPQIRPASEDPYGDPADQGQWANEGGRSAGQDPHGDPADYSKRYGAVRQHLMTTDPASTQEHVGRQLAEMEPAQADILASTLLSLVAQQGVDASGLCARVGIPPNQGGAYLSQLMGFLHQNHPDALAQAAAQQSTIASLLDPPSAGSILGGLASRFPGGR
jgi:hypothetical protein